MPKTENPPDPARGHVPFRHVSTLTADLTIGARSVPILCRDAQRGGPREAQAIIEELQSPSAHEPSRQHQYSPLAY